MTDLPTDADLDAIDQRWRDGDDYMQGDPMPPVLDDVPVLLAAVRHLRSELEVSAVARTTCRKEYTTLADAARDLLDALDGVDWGVVGTDISAAYTALHALLSGREATP